MMFWRGTWLGLGLNFRESLLGGKGDNIVDWKEEMTTRISQEAESRRGWHVGWYVASKAVLQPLTLSDLLISLPKIICPEKQLN